MEWCGSLGPFKHAFPDMFRSACDFLGVDNNSDGDSSKENSPSALVNGQYSSSSTSSAAVVGAGGSPWGRTLTPRPASTQGPVLPQRLSMGNGVAASPVSSSTKQNVPWNDLRYVLF